MDKLLWMVAQESTDPAKDDEVRQWLQNVHLPALLNVPGILSATLYVNQGPMLDALNMIGHRDNPGLNPPGQGWAEGQGKYVAIYEIETEDIKKTWKTITDWIHEMHRQHKDWRHPLLRVVSRSVWMQVGAPK